MSIKHMQMIFDAGDLSGSEKAALLAYCNHTDAHGYTWAGVVRVADMTGFSERTVKAVRKSLIERGLLLTTTRVARSGRRRTNITRVNLSKLESMKMPPREYDDNVIEELLFEDEQPSDQPKCNGCTGSDLRKCSICPDQGKELPLKEGAKSAPYPSEEPSSSSPGRADVPQQRKEKKKTSFEEQATTQILERLAGAPGGPPTLEESAKVLEHIRAEAAKKGTPTIHNIHTWVTGRHDSTLLADLEHVRHHAGGRNGARSDVCGLHPGRKTLPCRPCTLAGKQGLVEYLEPELARVGADARPDLVEALEVARSRAATAA